MVSQNEDPARVILVGGAPLAGKTTFARQLAGLLAMDHLQGDDLATAARMLAPEPLRSTLEPMRGYDWRDYYLVTSLNHQVESALAAHRAVWPAISPIIKARSTWGRSAVVEWWGFVPECVRASDFDSPKVIALWLHHEADVFVRRLELEVEFYRGAPNERGLIEAFARRSQNFNKFYRLEALKHGFPGLNVAPDQTATNLVKSALAMMNADLSAQLTCIHECPPEGGNSGIAVDASQPALRR